MDRQKLFTEFPPVSTAEWMEKVTADLKGADFDKKLVWRTNEGFSVKPFYRQEDIDGLSTVNNSEAPNYPFLRSLKPSAVWWIRQDVEVKDPAEANRKALELLSKGVTSLRFILPSELVNSSTLTKLLENIDLNIIWVSFKTCRRSAALLSELFVERIILKNVDPIKVRGSIDFNPFRGMLTKGKDCEDIENEVYKVAKHCTYMNYYRAVSVDSDLFCDAGAYITQELGFALAQGNEYMRMLTEKGMSSSLAAKNIQFNMGVSSNYFMEIAKFRAGRLLWAKIANEYKPARVRECEWNCPIEEEACVCAAKMYVHATTSKWNMTTYDPHVNMLRTQTEAMAAILGGVLSLTVLPFDTTYANPNEFSERIARNQQLMLRDEAYFNKVSDPAGGSYYIESLTVSIAEQAWKIFLDIEDRGGFYAAVKSGYIQEEIAKSAAKRMADVAARKEILLGTNQFPNFNEKVADKIQEKECHCCKNDDTKATIQTLSFARGAEQFETLRLATEKSGKRPKVFMLTIGNLAMRLARSQFSSNFFACAGYEIIDNLGFDTVEAGVEAARKANADIIVLCSSDDEYADLAPQAKNAIGSGKEILVIAGAPASMDDLKAQGITNFINVRSNVLETLQKFNNELLA